MMLQVGDDGVVTSVNEEELVYVDKMELEQLIESYQQLENDNKELKEEHRRIIDLLDKKLHENDDNDEYARRVKIDLIMELKKELGE